MFLFILLQFHIGRIRDDSSCSVTFFLFRSMSIKNMVVVVVLVFIWLKVSKDQILASRSSHSLDDG